MHSKVHWSTDWNLPPGKYAKVNAITCLPCHWAGPMPHQGEGIIFILDGCKDTTYTAGGGWFPELLKSEYRKVRAVMEAYSNAAVLSEKDGATACGLLMQRGAEWGLLVRVRDACGWASYKIDRWE